MNSWTKFVSMLVLSGSTALLGAACAAEVQEPAETQDPSVQPEALAEAESELSDAPLSDRDHRPGCERSCEDEHRDCRRYRHDHDHGHGHGYDRDRRCDEQYKRCLRRCRSR